MFTIFFILFLINHKIVNNYVLTPSHGFVGGNCHYLLTPTGYELNRTACNIECDGERGISSNHFCLGNDVFHQLNDVSCATFRPDIISESSDLTQITMKVFFCEDTTCHSTHEYESEITVYARPEFNSETFSIYDSIEHNFTLQGVNFRGFYKPRIVVQFLQSKLSDDRLKRSCLLEADCEIIDDYHLNCNKSAALRRCLPRSPIEFGSWNTSRVLFSSHGLSQSIYSFTVGVHQMPTFDSVTWDSKQLKFVIGSRGIVLLKTIASCVAIDEYEGEVYASNIYDTEGIMTFELDHLLLANKTLNCTVTVDDRLFFPLGLVTLQSKEPEPEQESIDYLAATILIVITCSLLILTLVVGFVVVKSQKNRELRLKSATGY